MRRWPRLLPLLLCLLLCTVSAGAMRTHGSVQNQRYDGYEIRQGVDVSEHNGKIDWKTVMASGQADFAFIRVGYRGYSSGGLYPDSRYKENFSAALAAGFDLGAYIYSQATTVREAQEEARYALELLGEYANSLTLPVVIDFEYAESNGYTGRLYEAHLSAAEATAICNAFCDTIRAAGLQACVYANPVMLADKLHPAQLNAELWLANYVDETAYLGEYTYWQYTSNGGVAGFTGVVDRNYWYVSGPDRGAQRAENVWLDTQNLSLRTGERATLGAELEPLDCVDTLRFYSEDPSVAYVDKLSGEVTGFRAGTTQVWAETANGLSAWCTVTVEGGAADAPSVVIAAAPDAIYTGGTPSTELTVTSDQMTGATAKVAIDYLNLRAWPSTDFAPLATLTRRETVTILGQGTIDGVLWYAVERDADGTRGYVSADYLADFSGLPALTEGVDYTATFAAGAEAHTATVTVQGLGAYQGSATATFRLFTFDDVNPGDWFYAPVLKAVRDGVMKGTSDTTFSPNASTTRAMMATVLYRMDGSPAVGASGFTDVTAGDWYAAAAAWAQAAEVDTGVGGNRFDPNGMLSRAQMVRMLYQYTRYLGYETPADRSLGSSFSDWSQVPAEAQDAVCWAVDTGLVQGMGDGTFAPGSGATRAQMCTILQRYEALLQSYGTAAFEPANEEPPALAGD